MKLGQTGNQHEYIHRKLGLSMNVIYSHVLYFWLYIYIYDAYIYIVYVSYILHSTYIYGDQIRYTHGLYIRQCIQLREGFFVWCDFSMNNRGNVHTIALYISHLYHWQPLLSFPGLQMITFYIKKNNLRTLNCHIFHCLKKKCKAITNICFISNKRLKFNGNFHMHIANRLIEFKLYNQQLTISNTILNCMR